MGYEWFISLRYLRARRKQTFISVISFISVTGVDPWCRCADSGAGDHDRVS